MAAEFDKSWHKFKTSNLITEDNPRPQRENTSKEKAAIILYIQRLAMKKLSMKYKHGMQGMTQTEEGCLFAWHDKQQDPTAQPKNLTALIPY